MCTQVKCIKTGNERAFAEHASYTVAYVFGDPEVINDLMQPVNLTRTSEYEFCEESTGSTFELDTHH